MDSQVAKKMGFSIADLIAGKWWWPVTHVALLKGLQNLSFAMINSMFWTEMTIIYYSVLHMHLQGVQLKALIF